MGRYRFVDPEEDRLPLSSGDWIDAKRELNAGEQRDVFAGMVKEQRAGEPAVLDSRRVGLTRLVAYIIRWSFLDKQGERVPVTESALNSLDADTYRELVVVIDAHEAQIEARREARKNGQGGESLSPAISPSPFVAAGASTGSVS